MLTRGEYRGKSGTYGVLVNHTKSHTEAILVLSGQVYSAYKNSGGEEYSYGNKEAKEFWEMVSAGLNSCTAKNASAAPFVLGTVMRHQFIKTKVNYVIDKYSSELAGAEINSETIQISLEYYTQNLIPKDIPYVKLTKAKKEIEYSDEDDIVVRTVDEIALEKEDLTWLKTKKYYIVNDTAQAEQIFNYLDYYGGVIAYDVETTGLKMNMFSQVNSTKQKELLKWNAEHPDDQIRADKLVGIIFCIQKDVSYYFPVGNRKFKNLYEDLDDPIRKQTIQKIRKEKLAKDPNCETFMGQLLRDSTDDELTPDVILMERCRNILETKHIVAHNGSFEWKSTWCYEIDLNLKDDTMILHQIMYKFRSTTSNRGESSALKYLSKIELGIDQWELTDFFPDFKNDSKGTVRGGKKGKNIDFSYMTYEGTRIYAPTDGDCTFQLYTRYKRDLIENHREMEYLYNVEIICACAIGYMEFYGHRLDESKIEFIKNSTKAKIALLESEIRQLISYSKADEIEAYKELDGVLKIFERDAFKVSEEERLILKDKLDYALKAIHKAIANNVDQVLNLASPSQVADLFYTKLQIPFNGEKMSVAKKEVKSLLKAKDDDGKDKYPVVHLYSKYKKLDTMLTKFFDALPNFMYPGGYIFSSFGQISTATGRMSCSKP